MGVYIKQKDKDYRNRPFVYLRIKGMEYDSKSKKPLFDFEPIQTSNHTSAEILNRLGYSSPPSLFFSIEAEKILNILILMNENPPEEWLELINLEKPPRDWKDYVGKRFLELINENLGNDEFEDRVYELFRALGFKVSQFGHQTPGEYPDGEVFIDDDIVLVYDCKNSEMFDLSADEKRKMERYVENVETKYPGKEVYGAFIAKGFDFESQRQAYGDYLFFQVNSLVYLGITHISV